MNFGRFVLLLSLALPLTVLTVPAESFAQRTAGSDLISTHSLRRMGLVRDWFTQIRVDSRRGGLIHLTHHVSSTHAETLYEVRHDEGIDRFTERELNAFGEPIGKVAAKQKADARAAALEAEGRKATVAERIIPEIALYATTSRAMLHTIDGRTGATLWTALLGNPEYPTEAPGANDNYVAAVNGSHVMLFDRRDGKQIWRRQAVGVPGAGPAVNNTFVFAPMISGAIEAYPVEDDHAWPDVYRSTGRAIHQPVATDASVSWSTDRGHLYVGRAESKGVRFRLETQRQVSATPAILPDGQVIAASLDGYAYSLDEQSGNIKWRYSTGAAIEHRPVVIGDAVYIVTHDGGMYELSVENGQRNWWTPGIRTFLAATKDRIYCISSRNELVSLDRNTGGRLGAVVLGEQDIVVTNKTTDRIYLATSDGLLQCLHEDLPEYHVPYFHEGIGAEGKQRQEVIRDEAPVEEQPMPEEPMPPVGPNPFAPPANNADPFAPPPRPANPPANNADPFGAGAADPFG